MKKALNITVVSCRTVARGKKPVASLNCPIGASFCPSEIISLKQSDGSLFRVKVHYDGGATHTLGNQTLAPIVASKVQSDTPIQLKTIESSSSATRTIATLNINDILFNCIIVKSLNVDSCCMPVPAAEW